MTRIIIDRRGIELSFETECMIVRGAQGEYRSIPMSRISQVLCMHSVQVSSQLIGQLLKHGIDFIVINNRYPEHGFELFADHQRQVSRRCLQYQWQQSSAKALAFSKAIVSHKYRAFLRVSRCFPSHEYCQQQLDAVFASATLEQLRGVEGFLQRQAFEYWKRQLPKELNFTKRIRRPPPDPVNALLSLTYTLAFQEAVRQCKRFGLDPALGFYHQASFGRASLACDIMEPTRPLVESFVVQLLTTKIINKRNFTVSKGIGCRLGKAGRSLYYEHYNQFMQDNKRRIEGPARWLAKSLNKELSNKSA